MEKKKNILTNNINPNHPKKGSSIMVEPIRLIRDIQRIKRNLAPYPRNLALFTLGINTNLRAGDLLALRCDHIRYDVGFSAELYIKEKKTGKPRRITLNSVTTQVLLQWTQVAGLSDTDWLFKSIKTDVPIKVTTLSTMVKTWCSDINLQGNYASHSLRKTWGYHQRVTFGVGLPELMVCFNHISQRQTLDYLCVQPEEIQDIYRNEL